MLPVGPLESRGYIGLPIADGDLRHSSEADGSKAETEVDMLSGATLWRWAAEQAALGGVVWR